MGQLKPGVSYTYHREAGITRAVEKATGEEIVIGWDYKLDGTQPDLDDFNLWTKIRLAGKKNPTLQKAIDDVKILYHLSKDHGEK